MAHDLRWKVRAEAWPLRTPFVLSRSSRTEIEIVTLELEHQGKRGRGECQPNPRFGESVAGVIAAAESFFESLNSIGDAERHLDSVPSMAARNMLDAAFLDLAAKSQARRVYDLLGLQAPQPVQTCFTISLAQSEAMAQAAKKAARRGHDFLKLKLGGPEDAAAMRAVRSVVPKARLVVDANEGWTVDALPGLLGVAAENGVEMVEQPVPKAFDAVLASVTHPVPICADESYSAGDAISALCGRYDMVNIKLDKVGGLRPAIALVDEAERCGLSIMLGCMVATSLGIAPAQLLAGRASLVDLDGPLLLKSDRRPAARFAKGGWLQPISADIWG